MKKKRPIILFDMDGTLTPARKPIRWDMVKRLVELTELADIGIVTGSGLDYLQEQCNLMWNEVGSVNSFHINLLPCNGTQMYRFWDYKWRQTFEVNMRTEIGNESYTKLLTYVMEEQKKLLKTPDISLPFTGNFISYRQSLLNWCPIGRDANSEDRTTFQEFDKEHRYRLKVKKRLEKKLEKENIVGMTVKGIEIALGGQTSLDIFPTGWNKTYSLQHFENRDIWFVGDRCEAGGNDQALYDVIKKTGKAFQTSGPIKTMKIIEQTIIPKLKESK
jgi:phosphomannomutase